MKSKLESKKSICVFLLRKQHAFSGHEQISSTHAQENHTGTESGGAGSAGRKRRTQDITFYSVKKQNRSSEKNRTEMICGEL